ncbi:MAG TPA: hypothetical protein P5333_04015, partial [Caldilinea sp.]|nr:hypothetical protein [Caldilinea sp.]
AEAAATEEATAEATATEEMTAEATATEEATAEAAMTEEATPAADVSADATPEAGAENPEELPATGLDLASGGGTLPIVAMVLGMLAAGGFVTRRRSK